MSWEQLHQKILRDGHNMDWGSLLTQGVWPYLQTANTILDLGCGHGNDSLRLAREGRQVVGLDISLDALDHARAKAIEENLEIEFVQADIAKGLPFPEARFEAVLANLSLHYFSAESTHFIFGEVRRVLKLGGVFCLHLNALQEGEERKAAGQIVEEIEPSFYLERDGVTRRYFAHQDLETLFVDWTIERVEMLEVVSRKGKQKFCWRVVVSAD